MPSKPSWQPRPTEPGLWVAMCKLRGPLAVPVSQEDFDNGTVKYWADAEGNYFSAFYGPIPEPPKPKRRTKRA